MRSWFRSLHLSFAFRPITIAYLLLVGIGYPNRDSYPSVTDIVENVFNCRVPVEAFHHREPPKALAIFELRLLQALMSEAAPRT